MERYKREWGLAYSLSDSVRNNKSNLILMKLLIRKQFHFVKSFASAPGTGGVEGKKGAGAG